MNNKETVIELNTWQGEETSEETNLHRQNQCDCELCWGDKMLKWVNGVICCHCIEPVAEEALLPKQSMSDYQVVCIRQEVHSNAFCVIEETMSFL